MGVPAPPRERADDAPSGYQRRWEAPGSVAPVRGMPRCSERRMQLARRERGDRLPGARHERGGGLGTPQPRVEEAREERVARAVRVDDVGRFGRSREAPPGGVERDRALGAERADGKPWPGLEATLEKTPR